MSIRKRLPLSPRSLRANAAPALLFLAVCVAAAAAVASDATAGSPRPAGPSAAPQARAVALASDTQVVLPIALRRAAPQRGPEVPLPSPTAEQPTPSASPAAEEPTPLPSPTAPFAPYVPVEVNVVPDAPAYTPNLEQIANPWLTQGLGDAARQALQRNGFVVVPADHTQFYEVYSEDRSANIPAFVTTDALLHTYHVLYDTALRDAESSALMAELRWLTAAMLAYSEQQAQQADGPVQAAANQDVAFFAVAARLLDPAAEIPDHVTLLVASELQLIQAHAGVSRSPIFGYDEDYSQYVPRGHYTRDESFQRYFRAMMWFGHMAFRLDPKLEPEVRRRETRAALLITHGLYTAAVDDRTALALWDRIYDVTAFFVGTADDLTPHDYRDLARTIYGDLPAPADLADDVRLDEFIAAARELRPPAILNTPLQPGQDRVAATMGLRFMGQRYIPDSAIFQQLVYDEVPGIYRGQGHPFTEYDSVRSFPRGLDVPAALGSARALAILTAADDTDYDGYAEQLAAVRDEFGQLDEGTWSSNLYWSWLSSLRPLLEVPGEGFPFFMRNGAWVDKSLNAWLGSWSQLRHDTILYAKPSMPGATGVPRDLDGYVEPDPWLFARLAALSAQMRAGLGDRGLLGDDLATRLDRMESLLLQLKAISELELVGGEPSAAQYALIRDIAGDLEALVRAPGEEPRTDQQIAVVADVHSVPSAGQALEEGVGDAFDIYVILPQPGDLSGEQTVMRGAVFSYYEFKWPMSDRLTDEAWQAMNQKPGLPDWTSSYMVAP